ncbi:hypothetical protein DL93DRAFT_1209644 [Clavulina sp. PMI_390]|nr:hypothetical protein DL93DRAFT_1209644 [Clavulina sp. PMI_390]
MSRLRRLHNQPMNPDLIRGRVILTDEGFRPELTQWLSSRIKQMGGRLVPLAALPLYEASQYPFDMILIPPSPSSAPTPVYQTPPVPWTVITRCLSNSKSRFSFTFRDYPSLFLSGGTGVPMKVYLVEDNAMQSMGNLLGCMGAEIVPNARDAEIIICPLNHPQWNKLFKTCILYRQRWQKTVHLETPGWLDSMAHFKEPLEFTPKDCTSLNERAGYLFEKETRLLVEHLSSLPTDEWSDVTSYQSCKGGKASIAKCSLFEELSPMHLATRWDLPEVADWVDDHIEILERRVKAFRQAQIRSTEGIGDISNNQECASTSSSTLIASSPSSSSSATVLTYDAIGTTSNKDTISLDHSSHLEVKEEGLPHPSCLSPQSISETPPAASGQSTLPASGDSVSHKSVSARDTQPLQHPSSEIARHQARRLMLHQMTVFSPATRQAQMKSLEESRPKFQELVAMTEKRKGKQKETGPTEVDVRHDELEANKRPTKRRAPYQEQQPVASSSRKNPRLE